MTMLQQLLDATKDIWTAYNQHPFVLGIERGDLDRDKFRYYIIQDYLYLIEYAKTFALGVAKAKSLYTMALFSSFIRSLMEGELTTHKGYIGSFGITEAEVTATPRALDNLSYTSYMLRVAYEEGEAEILAAILSCSYSYQVIAETILQHNPEADKHPFYGQWVRTYVAEDFAQGNRALIAALEQTTADYSPQQKQHLVDIFTACSRYELAFWDLGWKMSK